MTKEQAERLATWDRDYVARPVPGQKAWGVWCSASDHWVEFDQRDIDAAANPEDAGPWK